ncbi:MAG: FAD-dependent oxidoreductase [Lachnospiraceae bacterium]|nr:FAD-dependent oxidoreductase [Lachnospiraceae bacterium]
MRDIVIIGNGPAGLAAAIYAKRAGRDTLLISDAPTGGGQIATTYEVDNYPGLPGVSGMELGSKMLAHATDHLGCETLLAHVTEIRPASDGGEGWLVISDKEETETRTVIIATGATHTHLGVPGEKEHTGMGVSYCATCDGAFFKKRVVAVVGGGDVALEDAIFLSRFAKQVYLIHRRDEFRGAKILQEEALAADNITPLYDTIVKEVQGKDVVESLAIENVKTKEASVLPVNGVFMAVGIRPNLDGIKGLPDQNEAGYIIADETCATSLPGIFAAGDVRTKALRQVATAVADGANAVFAIDKYLHG